MLMVSQGWDYGCFHLFITTYCIKPTRCRCKCILEGGQLRLGYKLSAKTLNRHVDTSLFVSLEQTTIV